MWAGQRELAGLHEGGDARDDHRDFVRSKKFSKAGGFGRASFEQLADASDVTG